MRNGGGAAWYWSMSSRGTWVEMRHDGQRLEAFCSRKRKGVCVCAESGTMEAMALTSKGAKRKGMLYTRASIEDPFNVAAKGRSFVQPS